MSEAKLPLYVQTVRVESTHDDDGYEATSSLSKAIEQLDSVQVSNGSMAILSSSLEVLSSAVQQGFANNPPDSWDMQLNIGFSGAGAIPVLLKDGVGAELKITASWKKAESKKPAKK